MTAPVDKFQMLLRDLFQFDCADLDFGIDRIMNHKRGAIEEFIATDLPQAVAEELDRGALVFVNGDSFIPNAKALEPVFKARMFAAVEA